MISSCVTYKENAFDTGKRQLSVRNYTSVNLWAYKIARLWAGESVRVSVSQDMSGGDFLYFLVRVEKSVIHHLLILEFFFPTKKFLFLSNIGKKEFLVS